MGSAVERSEPLWWLHTKFRRRADGGSYPLDCSAIAKRPLGEPCGLLNCHYDSNRCAKSRVKYRHCNIVVEPLRVSRYRQKILLHIATGVWFFVGDLD